MFYPLERISYWLSHAGDTNLDNTLLREQRLRTATLKAALDGLKRLERNLQMIQVSDSLDIK